MLVWLSVWSKVQIVCIGSSWCHCHPKTTSSLLNLEWFYLSGTVLPRFQVVLEKRLLNCRCCPAWNVFLYMCVYSFSQSRANKWLTGWLIDYNYMLKIALHKFWWACQSLYLERAVWRHSGRLRGVIKQLHSTHPHLMALCPGLPGWAGTREAKPIWILLKQETVSGSGISWTICNLHLAPGR